MYGIWKVATHSIGNVGTKERSHIAPEREERAQACGGLLASAQSARIVISGSSWIWSSTSGGEEVSLNVVLEKNLSTIVGESFAELDEGDGVDSPRDGVGDTRKGCKFFF
jgi:hypothetical protein